MPSSHRHNRHDKTVLSVSCLVWRCELYDCSERVQTSDFLSATVLRCRGNPIHTADADATQTRQFCRVRRGAVNRLRCFHFAHCVPSSPGNTNTASYTSVHRSFGQRRNVRWPRAWLSPAAIPTRCVCGSYQSRDRHTDGQTDRHQTDALRYVNST